MTKHNNEDVKARCARVARSLPGVCRLFEKMREGHGERNPSACERGEGHEPELKHSDRIKLFLLKRLG